MDRLSTVRIIAGVAALAACDKQAGTEPAPSRVNAVKADPGQSSTEGFCDVRYPSGKGPAFELPPLAGASPPAPAGWRWVNVWATWCKPCVEEMPRIQAWREKLSGGGTPLALTFVSVDESDDAVATYRAAHPEVPDGVRIASPDQLPAWLKAVGLDEGAPIPVHVFVDPAGRVRCARAGGVSEHQQPIVKRLLEE